MGIQRLCRGLTILTMPLCRIRRVLGQEEREDAGYVTGPSVSPYRIRAPWPVRSQLQVIVGAGGDLIKDHLFGGGRRARSSILPCSSCRVMT